MVIAPEKAWRDAILATSKAEDIQNLRDAVESRAVMQAAAKAESTGIPKEAGTGAISLAIGFIDKIVTAKELIDKIIGEAEETLTTSGIGGWTWAPKT